MALVALFFVLLGFFGFVLGGTRGSSEATTTVETATVMTAPPPRVQATTTDGR